MPFNDHIGEVGGSGIVIAPAISVQAAAYATGQCIGGKLTLASFLRKVNKTSMIGSVVLRSKISNTVEIDALIFREDPALSTFNDRADAALHPDDVSKIARVISFATWVSPIGSASFSQVDSINALASLAGGVDAVMVLIAKGAITFTSPSDISVSVGVHRN